jgi:undecaprenyl diphosphate synthase
VLGICFNYGGQQEIADACKGVMASGVEAGGVTPELIASHLYAADMPPLDLVVRTSGEQRLSGFMLWQASYAELYFTDVLWPDFDEAELTKALRDYAARGRRFGS